MIKDLADVLSEFFPYCLLVTLPLFIALSPINPCEAAHEFHVHRLAQYELGGNALGSKAAAISMEARPIGTANVLRKIIVAKLKDLTIGGFSELASAGAGGLLVLLPPRNANLSNEVREAAQSLEDHLLSGEHDLPVYFAEESVDLLELVATLEADGAPPEQAKSALQALISSVSSSGYQLVSSLSSLPKPLADQSVTSIAGFLHGRGGDPDSLPTVVLTAHYDTAAAAPGLAVGADSNGSGVTVLMEIARLWSKLYSTSRTHAPVNVVFLVSGGGKVNYFGTKKWLEEQLDHEGGSSEILSNVPFCICLDSLGGGGGGGGGDARQPLRIHVSKPPKDDDSPNGKFIADLERVSRQLDPTAEPHQLVELVHKKINLADDTLAWEHERFSIRRLTAFTLSHLRSSDSPARSSLLDVATDDAVVLRNARVIAEALACTVYDLRGEACAGRFFTDSLSPSAAAVRSWSEFLGRTPRHTGLMLGSKPGAVVTALKDALKQFTHETKVLVSKRDKREPEFNFYDGQEAKMNSYSVKPAVFDLVLTLSIGAYLGLLYLGLTQAESLLALLTANVKSSKADTNGFSRANGHSKIKAQ